MDENKKDLLAIALAELEKRKKVPRLETNEKVLPELIKTKHGKIAVGREENKRTQAQRVVAKFGGVYQMRDTLRAHGWNIDQSTIYRWMWPRIDPRYEVNTKGRTRGGRSGLGGVIPAATMTRIVSIARLAGVAIVDSDFDTRPL